MRTHLMQKAAQIQARSVLFYQGLSQHYPAPHIQKTIHQVLETTRRSQSFHITDLFAAERQVELWNGTLKDVMPHYAIKSNNSPELCAFFHRRGLSFDVASGAEMIMCEEMGVDPHDIVYSNPCKMECDIVLAEDMGIELTVFDTESELHKLAELWPRAKLLMRIKTCDTSAQVQFSHRFGLHADEWESHLRLAKSLGLDVCGVHFHIGSGVANVGQKETLRRALSDVKIVFDMAEEIGFNNMHVIDCGGGFGAEATLHNIAGAIDEFYDTFPGCKWIAEPGRFMSASTQTTATRVIAVRREPAQVTVNDGLYGTWSVIPFDHSILPDTLPMGFESNEQVIPHQVFGPSCDGYDIVSDRFLLPHDIYVNDWIVFSGMGSYTQVSASAFNGVPTSKQFVLGNREMCKELERTLRGQLSDMVVCNEDFGADANDLAEIISPDLYIR